MARLQKQCRCGYYEISHSHPILKKNCCKKFMPMRCAKCGKDLDMTLARYNARRRYYCTDHCPKHEWQSDYDWPTECKHCGIDETAYWKARALGREGKK